MSKYLKLLLLASAMFSSSCGSGAKSWTDLPYDVAAEATLEQVLSDIGGLSGIAFSVEPELQERISAEPPDLPILLGLNVGQVLTLIQDVMPPETEFLYEELSGGGILLRTRFQQRADLTGADPVTIVEFDEGLGLTATLISDPAFDEECGGDTENILDLLGAGGVFEIVTEVESDPGGHSEFIGEFPPSVDMQIDGNEVVIAGASPWVEVAGAIETDGSFICSGSGVVAGFPDVTVTFEGLATPDGLSGLLTVGAGGELPGGEAAIYNVHP